METIECDHAKIQELFDSNSTDICIGYQELFNINANYKIIPLKKEPLVFVTNSHHAEEMGWQGKYVFLMRKMKSIAFLVKICIFSHFIIPHASAAISLLN